MSVFYLIKFKARLKAGLSNVVYCSASFIQRPVIGIMFMKDEIKTLTQVYAFLFFM